MNGRKAIRLNDSSPNERVIKAVQKAATAKGMIIAEYGNKILFPNGKELIIARFKKVLTLHHEFEDKHKPPIRSNTSAWAMKRFVAGKKLSRQKYKVVI